MESLHNRGRTPGDAPCTYHQYDRYVQELCDCCTAPLIAEGLCPLVKTPDTFYKANQYGYATAQAIILFLIILALTLAQNKIFGDKVFYE